MANVQNNGRVHQAWETAKEAAKTGYGKVKSGVQSDTFLKVVIGGGALGLLVAIVALAAILQHANQLPSFMDKVGIISDKAAFAMLIAGGTATLFGIVAGIIVTRRYYNKKQEEKQEKQRIQKMKDDATALAAHARMAAIGNLPEPLRGHAPEADHFVKITLPQSGGWRNRGLIHLIVNKAVNRDPTHLILVGNAHNIKVEEFNNEEAANERVCKLNEAHYTQNSPVQL
jgi:hypothetical protein